MAEAVKVGQGGYLDIVDNKGKLLAHPDKDKVQQNESVADRTYIAAVLQGQSGSQEAASTRGEQAMISYSPAKSIGWGGCGVFAFQRGEQPDLDDCADDGGIIAVGGRLCGGDGCLFGQGTGPAVAGVG